MRYGKLIEPKTKRPVDYPYYFVTIHRPYNTDDPMRIEEILETLNSLGKKVIFSIHPRTIARLKQFGIDLNNDKLIHFVDPMGYTESISY